MGYVYICPACDRHGFAWDGRAKIFMCFFGTCSHVVRVSKEIRVEPSRPEAMRLIWGDIAEVAKLKNRNRRLHNEIVRLKS